jgi:hypothetical protein
MTASRQGRERTFYLYRRGFRGGEGGIFSSENYGKSRVLGPGAAPPGPICSHSGEERISGRKGFGKKKCPSVFPLSFLVCFPLLRLRPWTPRAPCACRPQGRNFWRGGIFPGVAKGIDSLRRENLWDGEAESQWIVAARLLCHLQYLVPYLSRLQRIHLPDRLELWCKAPGDGSFGRPGGALDACFWGRTGRP